MNSFKPSNPNNPYNKLTDGIRESEEFRVNSIKISSTSSSTMNHSYNTRKRTRKILTKKDKVNA